MSEEKEYIVEEISKNLFLVYIKNYNNFPKKNYILVLEEGIKEIVKEHIIVNMIPHTESVFSGYVGEGARTIGYYVFVNPEKIVKW